jgi:hypothetical protein
MSSDLNPHGDAMPRPPWKISEQWLLLLLLLLMFLAKRGQQRTLNYELCWSLCDQPLNTLYSERGRLRTTPKHHKSQPVSWVLNGIFVIANSFLMICGKLQTSCVFKNQLKSTLNPYKQILVTGAKINQIVIWKINVCEMLLLLLLWLLLWWLLCCVAPKRTEPWYIDICSYIHIYTHVYMDLCIFICIYIYIYVYTQRTIGVCTCAYVYVYVYT